MSEPEDEARRSVADARGDARAGDVQAGGAQGHADAPGDEREDADEPVETPFDHPLFLPAVLLGLSLWFLWDGFIVPLEEHLTFNRWGFGVLAVATLWFGYKGVQEMRSGSGRSSTDDEGPGAPR